METILSLYFFPLVLAVFAIFTFGMIIGIISQKKTDLGKPKSLKQGESYRLIKVIDKEYAILEQEVNKSKLYYAKFTTGDAMREEKIYVAKKGTSGTLLLEIKA